MFQVWKIQNSSVPGVNLRYKKCRAEKLECGKCQEFHVGSGVHFELSSIKLYLSINFRVHPGRFGVHPGEFEVHYSLARVQHLSGRLGNLTRKSGVV